MISRNIHAMMFTACVPFWFLLGKMYIIFDKYAVCARRMLDAHAVLDCLSTPSLGSSS